MAVKLGNGNWAVKEDKLLAYNDNSGRFFNKEFDFARGSSATYVGKDGLIKSAASDVPRIDFSDSTNGALLLEPQSTNLLTYSEDLTQWSSKTNINVTLNSAISPQGVNNAAFINENTNNVQHFIGQSFSFTNGEDITISIYAKKNQRDVLQISPSGSYLTTSGYANYDLTNGLVTASGGGVNAEIEILTNDWFKCIAKFTVNNSATGTTAFFLQNSTTASRGASYQGDGTSGLYLWGAQFEQKSYATSYIPTSGSATTRLADVCNNSGSAQDFNSEEGVLYAEISALANDGTFRFITLSNGGDINNSVRLYFYNKIYGRILVAGVEQFVSFTTSYDMLDVNKIAIKHKENDFALWINGVEVGSSSSGSVFPIGTLDTLSFNRGGGQFPFYGKTKNIQVFNYALTDEQLAALTTI